MKGSAATYAPGKINTGGGSGSPNSPSGPSAMVLDMNAPSPTWRTIAPMSFGRFTHTWWRCRTARCWWSAAAPR